MAADEELPPAPELPDPTAQAVFRADIWLKGFLCSLVMLTPALVLGLTRDIDNPGVNDPEGWTTDVLLQVAVPGFLTWMLTNAVVSKIPTVMGFGMLREVGHGISLKESIRTNMTNSGVVLALFLTMLLAMWQVDKNADGYTRNDIWYRLFLLFGVEACTRGVVMVSTFLVFMEPLEESGADHFAVDNMIYLGEPMTCIGLVMLYFLQACLVWVFNTDAKYVGIVAYLILGYSCMRILVVGQYLQAWKNPKLTEEIRAQRIAKLKKCQAVDGTTKLSTRSVENITA